MDVSSVEKLEMDTSSGMCLRCTVGNGSYYKQLTSSEFRFRSGVWRLKYVKCGACYRLDLSKCSGLHPHPLQVSVHVESSENGRIVNVLPELTRFTDAYNENDSWYRIWRKKEQEILQAAPEFARKGVFKLLVVLDSDFGSQSSVTRSTSVQTTLLMNGIPCLDSLSKDLDQLMLEGSHYDVEFRCSGRTTRAHKSIVCQRSPVFAAMLTADMVEGRTGIVNIPDIEPDIFALFMRYIYCGRLDELTFDAALRLYEAADQYEVLGLAKRCSEYLTEHLTVVNAYEVLVVANAHGNMEWAEMVFDFMVENRVPWVSKDWSAFSDEHPKLAVNVLNRAMKAGIQ